MKLCLACELIAHSACMKSGASNAVRMVNLWNGSTQTQSCCPAQTAELSCIDQRHWHPLISEQDVKVLPDASVFLL